MKRAIEAVLERIERTPKGCRWTALARGAPAQGGFATVAARWPARKPSGGCERTIFGGRLSLSWVVRFGETGADSVQLLSAGGDAVSVNRLAREHFGYTESSWAVRQPGITPRPASGPAGNQLVKGRFRGPNISAA